MKMFRFLLLVAIIGGLITACGGGDDDADPTMTSDGSAQSTSSATSSMDASTSESETPSASDPATTATGDEGTGTATAEEGTGTSSPAETPSGESPTATTPETATSQPTTGTSPAPEGTDGQSFAYGWNVALRGDEGSFEHNAQTAMVVNQSGFGWVRFQVSWAEYERQQDQWNPLPYDRMIEAMYQSGLNVLVVVAKAPDWAQSDDPEQFLNDPADFADFVGHLAERYQGKVQAYEIWNEQNLAHEWGGHVDAAEYVELLQAGYQSIKAVDPNLLVVFGGLTPNGINDPTVAIDDVQYLQEVYAVSGGEISNYYDILGMHLNSTHHGPDATIDNPGEHEGWADHPSFFFRRGEDLRAVMVENGDEAKPAWITEFGWTTANQAPGYEYGVNNSDQEVAEYLVRSFDIAKNEWGWVTGAFVWNLNWSTLTDESDEKFAWSAVNADWSPRPAYTALTEMPKN